MLQITGTEIYLTCGDSAAFDITAKSPDGTSYTFQPGDEVKLTVKSSRRKDDTEVLVQRIATIEEASNAARIYLLPEDTKDLDFQKYYYDVQLKTESGWIDTIIENSVFKVGVEIG